MNGKNIYEMYLSSGSVDGCFSIIINKNEELKYHLELWESCGDVSVGVDFIEKISLEAVIEFIEYLKIIINESEFEPMVYSLGRLEILCLDCFRIQLVAYLEEREEYDGVGNFLSVELDITNAEKLLKVLEQVTLRFETEEQHEMQKQEGEEQYEINSDKRNSLQRKEMAEEIKWYCNQLDMNLPKGYPNEMSMEEMKDWLECWRQFDPIGT